MLISSPPLQQSSAENRSGFSLTNKMEMKLDSTAKRDGGREVGRMERFMDIALAFPRGAHQELFIEGVLRYVTQHELRWSFTTAPEAAGLSIKDLAEWSGDGILAAINTAEEASIAATLKIPVVNISSALPKSPVPRSIVNNPAIGALAAEHLIRRGFQNFAFYGLRDVEFSEGRKAGFVARLAEANFTCQAHLTTATYGFQGKVWLEQSRELATWLRSLPAPCGVFAVTDHRARHVLDACRQAELSTPEKIAVLGCDNDQVICRHSAPSITSVARNDQLEGYRAAELLHRMLAGESLANFEAVIPPVEVVQRESTSTFAVSDARLRQVLAYMHANIEEPITVEELTEHAGVSRRWLEYAFREALDETPYQYLRRQRLTHAKQLLSQEPTAKIYKVAQRTGFTSAKQLTLAFQQFFGMSPREFRRTLGL